MGDRSQEDGQSGERYGVTQLRSRKDIPIHIRIICRPTGHKAKRAGNNEKSPENVCFQGFTSLRGINPL